jgi:glucose/arabinose dehydrogenase
MFSKFLRRYFLPACLAVLVLFQSCGGSPAPAAQAAATAPASLPNITLPPGFSISVFATVPNARSLCRGTKTLFVSTMTTGKVYAVTDADGNGVADQVYTIASGLNTPNGVAFKDGNLYVAEINRIIRFNDIENHLSSPPAYQVIYDQLPKDRHHGWKFIAFGPDGKLYVPVGAPCNICLQQNPVYASITRMNPDGTGFEVFASGVRNSVGFDWDPQQKDLWFTDNGRDDLGDDIPSDELNHAPQKGLHFGYPFCHQGDIPDPEFGKQRKCSEFTPPSLKLGAHVASLGMRFYTGSMFPAEYRNQIFLAEHGSWNRTAPDGYRVMLVKRQGGKLTLSPFATGWLDKNGKVLGRPVDVCIAADGALLVSDDKSGLVYRISYKK